ncbi:MAG: type II secretion system inner membrane protein GspF [Rhodanobacteraceae bacterium]|nr:type II secretion system inner membrane protein GspF [Rhodanobacteraceae bacterium]
MPAFEYQALDNAGRTKKGVLQGDTPKAVRQSLRDQGLVPLEVSEVHEQAPRREFKEIFGRGISAGDLSILTRQWATLVRAGLPLDEALSALAEQSGDARARRMLVAVRSRLMEGRTLADSLGEFPESFPELYRSAVAAGEQSGKLDRVLERLAGFLEERRELGQKVIAALIYPALLSLVAFAIVSGLLGYVVPQVVGVFEQLQQQLPWPTRVLLALSAFVRIAGPWLLLALIGSAVAFRAALLRPEFRTRWHALLMGIPLIGALLRAQDTARFARTLSIATAASVPLLEALRLGAATLTLLPLREAVVAAIARVREGGTLSRALSESGRFPPLLTRLVGSGEKSGELEPMLDHAAELQEKQVAGSLNAFVAVLEPMLIVAMGALVLFMVLAILLPIFEMNQIIR